MEYLEGLGDLKKSIIRGQFHQDVPRQLGIFMAAIHGATHCAKLTQDELQKLDQEFQYDLLKMNSLHSFIYRCLNYA